jgi:hypothetical protein
MKANTYLPLFSGFYGSIWSEPCFDMEDEYYNIPKDMSFDDFVDWKSYYNDIAKKYCDFVEGSLSDFVSRIDFQSIESPKYYNFSNDSINCEIEFNDSLVDQYILDNYTSRDGFISFYENDASNWLDGWKEDSHKVGSILDFICINEEIEEPYFFEDMHISQYYLPEIEEYYLNDDCEI